MAYLTIQEAAKRLGTDESQIRSWIEQGLLESWRTPTNANLPSGLLGTVMTVQVVDEEQLYRVAESEGWLSLTRKVWQRARERRRGGHK